MAKLFKSLAFFGLIFAVTFFALRFYQLRGAGPAPPAVREKVTELRLLQRELTVLEQEIWERRKSGRAFADEEEGKGRILEKIGKLKKEIESGVPLPETVSKSAPVRPSRLKLGPLDGYQLLLLLAIGGSLLLAAALWVFGRRGARPAPVPPRRDPRIEELKTNLERFKSTSPGLKKETEGMDLSGLPKAPPAPATAGGVEAKVAALAQTGLGIADIAEKLRIDQDRVRLILKFKR